MNEIVSLEPCCPVDHDGVGDPVGFVEPVAGEKIDESEHVLGGLLRDTFLNRLLDEDGPLLGQNVRLFLGDALAQDVCFLHREPGHAVCDLHDLFLVHDNAIGRFEDTLNARMVVVDLLLAILAVDVFLDTTGLDGAGAIE